MKTSAKTKESRRAISRRGFLQASCAAAAAGLAYPGAASEWQYQRPNIVFVFADQWRADATGYAGDPNVKTPHIDALAEESVNFTNAVAGCPVCTPYRATLLTGQHPLTHGVFLNDVHLRSEVTSIAEVFAADGYDTAYVGKWHLDGHGRSSWIPPERQQGFDYWKVLECTHNYNESAYYAHDDPEMRYWDGYDAIAQTRDVREYIRSHDRHKPFLLMLSWGPPHAPYGTAPEEYRAMYDPEDIELRPNVPEDRTDIAREQLAGYYAHCTALDDCLRDLLETLEEEGLAEDTIFVFTSDHGDMLHSQGGQKKQQPWEESIRVPFLLRYPRYLGREGQELEAPINTQDILPTLISLSKLALPGAPALTQRDYDFDGLDFADYIQGGPDPSEGAALILCPHPFGQWQEERGGREYRGLRTTRYTYTRTLDGPWLLFDNENDPYQMNNLVDDPDYADLREELDQELQRRLDAQGDEFLPGMAYVEKWGYELDDSGTVPYSW